MMDLILLKSSRGYDELQLSESEGLRQAEGSEYFLFTLRSHNLLASTRVYAFMPYGSMQQFFEDIAVNWKGWKGEKKWSSLEGELSFVCTSDDLGHVAIEVALSARLYEDGWEVRNVLYVDAGQLTGIAAQITKFFAT